MPTLLFWMFSGVSAIYLHSLRFFRLNLFSFSVIFDRGVPNKALLEFCFSFFLHNIRSDLYYTDRYKVSLQVK